MQCYYNSIIYTNTLTLTLILTLTLTLTRNYQPLTLNNLTLKPSNPKPSPNPNPKCICKLFWLSLLVVQEPITTILIMTTCSNAIKAWEAKHQSRAEEAKEVKLYCQIPPIAKMDASLNSLKNCEHLSLSTNTIDKFILLPGKSEIKFLRIQHTS